MSAQGCLALYTCRECGVELEYQGVGRPPVFCAAHRPASFPPVKHPVRVRQQLNGGVSDRRRGTDPGSSRTAISNSSAGAVEGRVLAMFRLFAALTDDELAGQLPDVYAPTIKSARSRLTLSVKHPDGVLVDSGMRRPSNRGRDMTVWKLEDV